MSQDHRRSMLPTPATLKRPAQTPLHNPRVSMAPMRNSVMAPPPVPALSQSTSHGYNPRQSLAAYRSQSSNNPLLMSTSKAAVARGKTPMKASGRQSLWGGAPTAASTQLKDSRPLRDRTYQARVRADIASFLQSQGHENVGPILANITSKDYRNIFTLLLFIIDPNYPLSRPGSKNTNVKWEEEVIKALGVLKYPFANGITVAYLATPGAQHAWPSLLGVLVWMVDICKIKLNYVNSNYATVTPIEEIPAEFDDKYHHAALGADYTARAYSQWMDGADEFIELKQEFEERYAKKNEEVAKDTDQLQKEIDAKLKRLAELKKEAEALSVERQTNETCKEDMQKFDEILKRYRVARDKKLEANRIAREDIERKNTELQSLLDESKQLQSVIDAQNLSPEEITRMKADQESLKASLDDLRLKIAETGSQVLTMEVTYAKRSSDAEEAVDTYEKMISHLPIRGSDDLHVELNLRDAKLLGADVRSQIKPALTMEIERLRLERGELDGTKIKLEAEYDRLTLEFDHLEDQCAEIDRAAARISAEADDLKEAAAQEAQISSDEANKLENDLAQARMNAKHLGMGVKQHLQRTQFAQREQTAKLDRLRDETVRAIIKNSGDIATFRAEVAGMLREVKDYAEAES